MVGSSLKQAATETMIEYGIVLLGRRYSATHQHMETTRIIKVS